MNEIKWKIERTGRAWTGEEAIERLNLLPESAKIELYQGKLFWSDEERLAVMAMLLENIGIDKILPLVDSDMLFEALAIQEVGEEKLREVIKALDWFKEYRKK